MKNFLVLALSGSGVLGGAETYVIRIITWLKNHGIPVMLMHKENENFHPIVEERLNELNVERLVLPSLKSNQTLPDFWRAKFSFPENSHVRIICFQSPANFFAAEMIKRRAKKYKVSTFHYMIHQDDYCRNKTQATSNKIFQGILRYSYKSILKKMDKMKNTIYLSEDYSRLIHANFNLPDMQKDYNLIRLGIKINDLDIEKVKNRFLNKPFSILTMTRFDFPEKSYLLGLIDEFSHLCAKYPDIRLVIIGAGEGELKLKAQIDKQDENIRKNISLVGIIPYDKLDSYFEEATVYIGIATTVLDASNSGLLSVISKVNSNECSSPGLFFENPNDIYGYSQGSAARDVIERIIAMSEREYLESNYKNYDALSKTYDIDVIMPKLLELENKSKKPTLSIARLFLIRSMRFVIDTALRLKKR